MLSHAENPDAPALSETERALVDYGRRLSVDANRVGDELYARLEKFLTPARIELCRTRADFGTGTENG